MTPEVEARVVLIPREHPPPISDEMSSFMHPSSAWYDNPRDFADRECQGPGGRRDVTSRTFVARSGTSLASADPFDLIGIRPEPAQDRLCQSLLAEESQYGKYPAVIAVGRRQVELHEDVAHVALDGLQTHKELFGKAGVG